MQNQITEIQYKRLFNGLTDKTVENTEMKSQLKQAVDVIAKLTSQLGQAVDEIAKLKEDIADLKIKLGIPRGLQNVSGYDGEDNKSDKGVLF